MTIAKWNEKAAAKLAVLCDSGAGIYSNIDDGVVFSDRTGFWFMFAAGQQVLTACPKKAFSDCLARHYEKALTGDAALAESMQAGTVGGRKARKFSAGGVDVFVYETILRLFPKNTLFYLASPTAPVVAGLWENGRLHIIGAVAPFRLLDHDFIPAAA